ncbi:helix-turn-helix domain-containing protein [Devosia lacusdianchii]|uniref:helix-turn-helix domain-containing protein n=1 Tax=Devosia lacusdianchii TaxID=2917991 RepID=UPI001F066B00|nr:helix-turn-helix domain-containing protein [Devosia sp. JXJ CY 41]
MDALIAAAAWALATGDVLGALKRVALRDDPPALALRGIAMAQLGDLTRAKALLKSAARGFGPREAVARARCIVAEAEIALVSRDLGWPEKDLATARTTLEARGDRVNATHALHLEVRRLLLLGHLDEAERRLALPTPTPTPLPPALRTARELALAGIAMRRPQAGIARIALARARIAAQETGITALVAEVESASTLLNSPAARLIAGNEERLLLLDDVERIHASAALVVDANRNLVRRGEVLIPLATRPVLFALMRTMAEAWPADVTRDLLLARAFGARHVDESHRARLRVEIGRLRAMLRPLAGISATERGFALKPRNTHEIVVLAPPVEERHAAILALLADGEAWSSSSLAIALGTSARTVQRALDDLATAGKAQSFGQGRARRWIVPSVPGFPTILLLPGPLPGS